jgi:predicted oxidoreductase
MNTELKPLSKIIAGTMNWGVWDKNFSTTEMAKRIEICVENKITTFDHADIYGGYTTEASFGKAFEKSKIDRDKVVFISKCGIKMAAENQKTVVKHYDYSKSHIIQSVENSLRHLQTDYLDILLLHRPSPLLEIDEVYEVIEKLKKEGKIIEFGVSNFTNSQTELVQSKLDISYNQIEFSLTNLEAMTDGSLDYMQVNKIRPMAWSPLGLIYKEKNTQTIEINSVIEKLVDKYTIAKDLLLLAWIMQHPAKIIPVVGTTSIERLEKLHSIFGFKFDIEDWFSLWEASLGRRVP